MSETVDFTVTNELHAEHMLGHAHFTICFCGLYPTSFLEIVSSMSKLKKPLHHWLHKFELAGFHLGITLRSGKPTEYTI